MRKTYIKIMSGICMMPLLTACGNAADTMKSADIFAMDTYMNIKAYGRDAEAAVAEAEARIYKLEQTFSVTDETSDIRKINHAEGQPVTVSADTVSVLQTAQNMHHESGGAFCISLYPVLCAWGFTVGEYRIPSDSEITNLLQNVDDTQITVDAQTVRCPDAMQIDLGAVAKGYTGDAVMEIMQQHQIASAIINLGGNVQTCGSKPDGSAWTVGITDPFAPDSLLGTVRVTDKAVITSGNYERYFTGDDGQKYWHILDPADGFPADRGLVSVTVIGSSGAECDALSTALFVEGTEQAIQHWRRRSDFEMILVTADSELLLTEGIAADYTAKKEMPCRVVQRDEEP
ncbi:MAG: FAD:protein FMN transferase [Oscillospiraceae bacterium]|nr:FAD:protein FMN transferase [Oscillospiraceae bacterium]MBQ9907421.1 FAD:protein FMN transferase [Oscillospiraceae bacterium]